MQITQEILERAAQNLCAIRGVQPELPLQFPDGTVSEEPAWQCFLPEVAAALQVQHAVQLAIRNLGADGRPVKPIILGSNGQKLN